MGRKKTRDIFFFRHIFFDDTFFFLETKRVLERTQNFFSLQNLLVKKNPFVRHQSLEKKRRDFFEATTPRPRDDGLPPLERHATFSRKKKKRGRLRRVPFCCVHIVIDIICKQRYKTANFPREERARKGETRRPNDRRKERQKGEASSSSTQ